MTAYVLQIIPCIHAFAQGPRSLADGRVSGALGSALLLLFRSGLGSF